MPFDAKNLLETVVAGNSQPQPPSQDELSNLLNQVMHASQGTTSAAGGAGGLGGILGQVLGGAGQGGGLGGMLSQALGGAQPGVATPGGLGGALGQVLGGAGAAGGLGGILNQVLSGAASAGSNLNNPADVARSIFGSATQGVQDATRATGATPQLDEIIKQITGGQGSGDLLAKARQIIASNPAAAGALAGALGTMVVGSGAGRTIAANAAKIGGLVLIGGLAYKAYENYREGQSTSATASAPPTAAPAGTGFEPQAQTNDTATLYLRAMIAAAGADGTVDAKEQARISAGLQQAGHSADAAAFVQKELSRPATPAELAAACTSPEIAVQCYTAARVAIEPHSAAETKFLGDLAAALKLDPGLVQHIDAAASANKV